LPLSPSPDQGGSSKGALATMSHVMHILTFDVEDWFHLLEHGETANESQWSRFESRIVRSTNTILECLAEVEAKATFFCLGWVARAHPGLVKAIHAAGHEIGSHSDNHQLVHHLTPERFKQDLLNSIKSLEDLTGRKVRAYRSPGFSITKDSSWAFSILAESGIELDSSIFASRHAHCELPVFRVAEPVVIEQGGMILKQFPVVPGYFCARRINFSGGGYFRLLPYALIRHLMSKSDYVMAYFHPRDFDADQPLVPNLPPHRIFKSYIGLRSSLKKFKSLLKDFDFIDLSAANDMINWSAQPKIQL
jgi:peptidoglycan-N-acetylglucosamine deacetylase